MTHDYLWNGQEPGWVLLSHPDGNFTIYNELTHGVLLVEGEQQHKALVHKMLEANCAVRSESDITPNSIPVDPSAFPPPKKRK